MGANDHLTVVPEGEQSAHSTVETLAEDIRERGEGRVQGISVKDSDELYVNISGGLSQNLSGMDTVCAIAYDHGYVPVGIIDSGAARFIPRTEFHKFD